MSVFGVLAQDSWFVIPGFGQLALDFTFCINNYHPRWWVFFLGQVLLLGFWTYDWDLTIAIALISNMINNIKIIINTAIAIAMGIIVAVTIF